MAKLDFHDLSAFVYFDLRTKQYKLVGEIDNLPFHLQTFLGQQVDSQKVIQLPTMEEQLQKVYPFIDQPPLAVINQIIQRNQKISQLIKFSLLNQTSNQLMFFPQEEKDPFVLDLARQFIYALNKLIYKYELTHFYADQLLINNDVNYPFIGNVDLVAKNKQNEWYLFLLKTSKTNYLEKYYAEAFLQKTLLESNSKIKVKESFILNPRQERYLMVVEEISSGEKFNLLN